MRIIDADALIKAAEHEAEGMSEPFKSSFAVYVEWLVDKQPSVQPEQRWIPCSEKLPEYGMDVLTFTSDDDYEINHIIDEEEGEWFFNGAVAWMPLPEPWKGDTRE